VAHVLQASASNKLEITSSDLSYCRTSRMAKILIAVNTAAH